jgi:hypothetical protein
MDMEGSAGIDSYRGRRMSSQRNKVYSVTTVDQVAKDLHIDVDRLHDITLGMNREDGVIWVYGLLADDAVMAFTYEGIEEIENLLEIYREDPEAFPTTCAASCAKWLLLIDRRHHFKPTNFAQTHWPS